MCRPVHIAQRNAIIMFQRIEVRKIGDMRQMDHRHIQAVLRLSPHQTVGQAVLIIQIDLLHGDHAHHRNVKPLLDHAESRLQNLNITTEFIDDETLDAGPLLRLQQTDGSI